MRIKELEDVLKLVGDMPRDRQLECVRHMMHQVEHWEDQSSLGLVGDDWGFYQVQKQRRMDAEKRKPPG